MTLDVQTKEISVRGKRLYVEMAGASDAPALLFVHGGPGGCGCYEFMLHQRERLGKHLRLIAIDQRGVLRSEALTEEDPLTIQDLIDDLETVREHVGIAHWSVLGHSFGGFLATMYAHQYPQSVKKLLLDCPTLDFDLSTKFLLAKSADEFRALDDAEHAAQAETWIESDLPLAERFSQMIELTLKLGEQRERLYWYRPIPNYFGEMKNQSGLADEFWERTGMHVKKVFADPHVYESLLPLLPDLRVPTLLLRGESDSVTCEVQATAILRDLPLAEEVMIAQAGHVPCVEQADLYAEIVTAFVLR